MSDKERPTLTAADFVTLLGEPSTNGPGFAAEAAATVIAGYWWEQTEEADLDEIIRTDVDELIATLAAWRDRAIALWQGNLVCWIGFKGKTGAITFTSRVEAEKFLEGLGIQPPYEGIEFGYSYPLTQEPAPVSPGAPPPVADDRPSSGAVCPVCDTRVADDDRQETACGKPVHALCVDDHVMACKTCWNSM